MRLKSEREFRSEECREAQDHITRMGARLAVMKELTGDVQSLSALHDELGDAFEELRELIERTWDADS